MFTVDRLPLTVDRKKKELRPLNVDRKKKELRMFTVDRLPLTEEC